MKKNRFTGESHAKKPKVDRAKPTIVVLSAELTSLFTLQHPGDVAMKLARINQLEAFRNEKLLHQELSAADRRQLDIMSCYYLMHCLYDLFKKPGFFWEDLIQENRDLLGQNFIETVLFNKANTLLIELRGQYSDLQLQSALKNCYARLTKIESSIASDIRNFSRPNSVEMLFPPRYRVQDGQLALRKFAVLEGMNGANHPAAVVDQGALQNFLRIKGKQ